MDKDQWEFGNKPPAFKTAWPTQTLGYIPTPYPRPKPLPWWHKDRLPFNVRWWLWYGWTGRIYAWIHRNCH